MADVKVTLIAGLDALVAQLPEVQTPAKKAAEDIARAARDIAPVETGDYRKGIITQKTKGGYRVLASDPKSAWVEFGVPSHGQSPQFVMRRAVGAAGYKFRKGRSRG